MKRYLFALLTILCLSLAIFVSPARADGSIIPEPPICMSGPCPPLPRPMEVLEILGPPAPTSTTERATRNVSDQHFKYTCWETRRCDLILGYILVLPFVWRDQRNVDELVVEFDEMGIVSDCYRVTDDCIWQPLQGEGSRESMTLKSRGMRRKK